MPDVDIAAEFLRGEVELHLVMPDRVLAQVGLCERGQERQQVRVAVHAVEEAGPVRATAHPLGPGVAHRELLQLPRNLQRHGHTLIAQDPERLGHSHRRQQHVRVGLPELGERVHPSGRLQPQVPPIPGHVTLDDPHPARTPARSSVHHYDPSGSCSSLAADATTGQARRQSI
jgi:hypothetical protein